MEPSIPPPPQLNVHNGIHYGDQFAQGFLKIFSFEFSGGCTIIGLLSIIIVTDIELPCCQVVIKSLSLILLNV